MKTDSTLMRVRRANPELVVPIVDPGDLFAAITALPQERDHRPLTRSRRGVALVVAFAAAVVLVSTAYAVSNWIFSDAVGPDVTEAEYLAAQHELELPPGATWPTLHFESNSVTGRGAGGGHAVLIAQNAWECYWVKAIRGGDTAAATRAHRELQSLLDHNVLEAPPGAPEDWLPANPPKEPWVAFAHDGGLSWTRQNYRLAAAGHPRRLEQSCRANAPG
jgi:hypothetical protein